MTIVRIHYLTPHRACEAQLVLSMSLQDKRSATRVTPCLSEELKSSLILSTERQWETFRVAAHSLNSELCTLKKSQCATAVPSLCLQGHSAEYATAQSSLSSSGNELANDEESLPLSDHFSQVS